MFLLSVVFLIGVSVIAMMWSGDIGMFIDVPSLLLIVPPAIFFSIAATSWRDLRAALSLLVKGRIGQDAPQYQRSRRVMAVLGNSALMLGVIVCLIGAVSAVNLWREAASVGQFNSAVAVLLLTLMYGAGLKLVCYLGEMRLLRLSEAS